jgi:sarcosine oxidase subunit beta
MAPSIVVIGAGVVGLCSAWHLMEQGVDDVVVVDAAHPASGSSGLAVGLVQTQHLTEHNIEIRAVSMAFLRRLEREQGLEIVHNGYVRLGFDDAQVETFHESVSTQQRFGVRGSRVLSPTQLRELIPDIRVDDIAGALYGPQDGYLDGHLLCNVLVDGLRAKGATIVSMARVTGAEQRADGQHHITTTRGTYSADYVVNAAGAWAPRIAELLGTVAPIRPERHQAIIVELGHPLPYVMPSVMGYSPGTGTEGLFFRYEKANQLVAGLHSLDPVGEIADPDSYNRGNDMDFIETLAELFDHRLPGIEDPQLGAGWAGIYPMSADGVLQVGPAPGRPTVISACGAGGAGIMLGPAIGNLVADWIVSGRAVCVSDGDSLTPQRFDSTLGA